MYYKKTFYVLFLILSVSVISGIKANSTHAQVVNAIPTNCQCGANTNVGLQLKEGEPNSTHNYRLNTTYDLMSSSSCPSDARTSDEETIAVEFDSNGWGYAGRYEPTYYPGSCSWISTSWTLYDDTGSAVDCSGISGCGYTNTECAGCQNTPPTCNEPIPNPSQSKYDLLQTIQVNADAQDSDGDALSYTWQASTGTMNTSTINTDQLTYTFPNSYDATTTIAYTVSDGSESVTCSINLETSDVVIIDPTCGDSNIDAGETCDDGSSNTDVACVPTYPNGNCSYCTTSCQQVTLLMGVCGDGDIDVPYEECDDGTNNGELCIPSATESCTYCDDCKIKEVLPPVPAVCNESCSSDSDCSGGLTCEDETCQNNECLNDSDCICPPPLLSSCNESCSTSSDCSGILICESGTCQNADPLCQDDSDCICDDDPPLLSVCNESCSTVDDCSGTLTCESGTCQNAVCLNDSDCICDEVVNTSLTVNTKVTDDASCIESSASDLEDVDVTILDSGGNTKTENSGGNSSAKFFDLEYDQYEISARKSEYVECFASGVTAEVSPDSPETLNPKTTIYLYENQAKGWLSANQGNVTSRSNFSQEMPVDEVVLYDEGTIMAESVFFGEGSTGSSAYVYIPYDNDQDKFFDIAFTAYTASDDNTQYVRGNFEIKPDSESENSVEYELEDGKDVLLVDGNLTISYKVAKINGLIIVNGDLTINSVREDEPAVLDEPLIVDGELWVRGRIIQKRSDEVKVNSAFSYAEDQLKRIPLPKKEYRQYTE